MTESAEVDLITNDASFFSFDDDGPTLTVTVEVSETEAAALAVELDETTGDADRYSSADTPDTYVNDDNGYLAQATTDVEGGLLSLFATLGGDYGSDLAGTTVGSLSFIGLPETGGLATTLSATDGGAISLEAASATLINGVDTDGDVVFSIEIVNVGTVADPVYQLVTTQYEALDHGADDNLFDSALNLLLEGEGSVQLEYEVTRTDGDGDVVTESAEVDLITNDASFFSFDDDGPTLTVTAEVSETEAAALAVELDETTGDADRYSSADTPDTYVNDDNGYLAQATTNVDGGLISLFATLGGDYGSDGAGTTVSSLSFVGLPAQGGLATTLSATDGGAISLEAASATLINGVDTDGDVVFSIEIVNVGTAGAPEYQLVTTQYEALDHGADDNLFDSALNLLLEGEGSVQLEYEVTRIDGDGDVVTESAEVDLITNDASFFSFDDDGPTLTVTAEVSETEAAALAVELDETTGDADRYSSADTPDTYVNDDNGYLAQATTNVDGGLISLFATLGGDYGSDLAGTTVGSLSFIGLPETGGLATTLSATDGGAISLEAASATLINGVDTDGDVVFSIEIVNVGTVGCARVPIGDDAVRGPGPRR